MRVDPPLRPGPTRTRPRTLLAVGLLAAVGAALLGLLLVADDWPGVPWETAEPTPAPRDVSEAMLARACSQTPTVPRGGYGGLISDGHFHTIAQPSAQRDVALALLEEMNTAGGHRVAVSRPPLDLDTELPLARTLDEHWGALGQECPRLLPLVGGFDARRADAVDYVRHQLDTGRFAGVGPIDLCGTDEVPRTGAPELRSLLSLLDEREAVLRFHCLGASSAEEKAVAELVAAYPRVRYLCFGCAPELSTADTLHFSDTRLPDAVGDRERGGVLGLDVLPEATHRRYRSGPVVTPGYSSVSEGLALGRRRLMFLPAKERQALATGRFDRLFPLEGATAH